MSFSIYFVEETIFIITFGYKKLGIIIFITS